jgi:hypothetical protein
MLRFRTQAANVIVTFVLLWLVFLLVYACISSSSVEAPQLRWVWSDDDEACGVTCTRFCQGTCLGSRMSTDVQPPMTRATFGGFNDGAYNTKTCVGATPCSTVPAPDANLAPCAFPIRNTTTKACQYPTDSNQDVASYCEWHKTGFQSMCLCLCKDERFLL